MSTEMAQDAERRRNWKGSLYFGRFVLFHLICLAAFWTGVTWEAIAAFFVLYAVRMFGITGGYHRYFSHRTYKMGRVMQFVMAWIAQSSIQKGVLWWASHHRHHHTHSDDPDDVHSPKHHGFWYAHLGWIFDPDWADTDDKRVKDLSRYPELVWLDRWHILPPTVLGVATYLVGAWIGGGFLTAEAWSFFVVGFMCSTVALFHSTFTINSLSHVIGDQRYETDDESRNHWLLALITFGEGWHNNHHHYQASANQGFYWWEYDITYYILKALSWVGLVHDLRNPPEHVIEDEPHPAVAAREDDDEEAADESDESAPAPTAGTTERFGETVQSIQLSAARAQEEASKQVCNIKLAAATRYDELSDRASQGYTEVSEAASKKVDDIKESARHAQEEAGAKVDRIVESLQQPDPEPATD